MSKSRFPHIQALLDAEQSTCRFGGNIRFNRINDNTLSVSCLGYCHQDLNDIELKLLKLGCRYDHKRGIQQFDKECRRTFSYFIEPKDAK